MVWAVEVNEGATKFKISFTLTCGLTDVNSEMSIMSTATGVFATVLFLFLDPTKTTSSRETLSSCRVIVRYLLSEISLDTV